MYYLALAPCSRMSVNLYLPEQPTCYVWLLFAWKGELLSPVLLWLGFSLILLSDRSYEDQIISFLLNTFAGLRWNSVWSRWKHELTHGLRGLSISLLSLNFDVVEPRVRRVLILWSCSFHWYYYASYNECFKCSYLHSWESVTTDNQFVMFFAWMLLTKFNVFRYLSSM